MNLYNIFAGVLGIIIALALIFVTYTPMINFINIFPTTLKIFASVAYFTICVLVGIFVPIALSSTDDAGQT